MERLFTSSDFVKHVYIIISCTTSIYILEAALVVAINFPTEYVVPFTMTFNV